MITKRLMKGQTRGSKLRRCNLRRFLAPVAGVACVLAFHLSSAHAATIFTHWTTINTTTNVATGTLGPIGVTFSGGHLFGGVTIGTFTGFNFPFFSPPLAQSDVVEFLGPNPPATFTYTVSFSSPVTNPRLHIGNLASRLTFSTALTRLSGQATFVVAGNTVTGALNDFPINGEPKDSNGTVELFGTFSSFTFTAQALDVFSGGGDGIDIQIGEDISEVPEPSTALLMIGGLGSLALRRWLARRTVAASSS